jgi:tetratricopeptide (TPR) repeat protein
VKVSGKGGGKEVDPLLSTDPVEDRGAHTASWYGFQHNCALRLLLAAVAGGERLGMVFETHEDILLTDAGGRVAEAIGVKHRERGTPWSIAELLRTGGLAHLFATWQEANGSIGVRCMSNAKLRAGAGGADRIRAAAGSPDDEHRPEVIEAFARVLGCDEPEAEAFLDCVHLDVGLPFRSHIDATQATQLLVPALKALDLPLENRDGVYRAALHLVADRSKDVDPLDVDARLALLRGTRLELGERAARIESRTVTSDDLIACLREAARVAPAIRHYEVHPVALPRAFVERPAAEAAIRARIESDRTRVVAVKAVGGEGKSTVVKRFVEDESKRAFSRTFSFSFRSGTPEEFLDEAYAFFAPEAEAGAATLFAKARRLARALLDVDALLVLHEFEEVLVKTSGADFGRFVSREIHELLTLLLSAESSRSKVLLTTRVVPVEIHGAAGYDDYPLPALSEKESLAYLRKRGVAGSDRDLEAAADRFFRHALTLAALADFLLRSRWQGDIAGAKPFERSPRDRDQRLAAVLGSYAELLSEAERDVVVAIAASSGGLEKDALVAVCEAVGVAGEELDTAFAILSDSVLLSRDAASPAEVLTIHHLIAEYFLGSGSASRVRQIRTALASFHGARMPAGRAGSVGEAQPGIAAFEQHVELRQWEPAHELYSTRLPVTQHLFWSGHYRVCRSLTEPLIDAWERGEIELDGEAASALLLDRGRVEAKVATVDSALGVFDRAAELASPGSATHARAVLYGVEVALEGGRCRLARDRLGGALRGGSLDPEGFRVAGRRGYVQGCLGNRKAAAKLLSKAIDEAGAAHVSGDYTATGYLCLFLRVRADLAIRFGEIPQAHADIDRALELAAGPKAFHDYEGHLYRARGDAYLAVAGPDGAHGHYARARRIAAESGYRWLRAEALIGLSRCAILEGEEEEALHLADDALEIAREGGWWVELGSAHLLRGEIGLVGGELDPREDIAAARALARQSGHHLLASQAEQVFQEWTEGRS